MHLRAVTVFIISVVTVALIGMEGYFRIVASYCSVQKPQEP